jgi:phosphate transport system substrate-binding protein
VSLTIQSCATDAFVFLLSRKNPVDNITFENIRSIYTGAITNWEKLGGLNQVIRPYQRERNSGSQEMMLSMVMKELTIIDAPDMIKLAMTGPYNALLKDSAGIGYTVYFYGKNMAPQNVVKFCSIDGVFPDYNTILSRKYCLWSDVYMISRTDLSQTHSAAYLRDYILSPAGQTLIKSCGYVPVDQTGIQ